MFVCCECGKLFDDDISMIIFGGFFFCSDECLKKAEKRGVV